MRSKYFINKPKTMVFHFTMVFLLCFVFLMNSQVKVDFTQRTSQYTPEKKIYKVKGDFTMFGNTCLSPQNYSPTSNNNGQMMQYVDIDNDPETWNSSAATLELSTENNANPSCSNIIYAGLYWTGKSDTNEAFTVTKQIQNGSQTIDSISTLAPNDNIIATNYIFTIASNNPIPIDTNVSPIYNFIGNGNTYSFQFPNGNNPIVSVSVNGETPIPIPVVITISGTIAKATLSIPFVITNGDVAIKINELIRSTAINLNQTSLNMFTRATVNVFGTIPLLTTIVKNFNKRVVSLKGPNSNSYTQFFASENDIYYPIGTDDGIYTAYKEITDYVKSNGLGSYIVADMALLEGNPGGTGYSGGWSIIVIYENFKMKCRDVTLFDGYAYVKSTNTSGYTLPVSGFNAIQTGNVGLKMGVIASEGDVSFAGDYFKIQKNSDLSYMGLSHSGNSSTNFFNSSINTNGERIPNLINNTGIDISIFEVPNVDNLVIANNQNATNFLYGTSGDTYSIFAIAMAVDSYYPELEALINTTTINNIPVINEPCIALPNQEIGFNVAIKNLSVEAINNCKFVIPIPYNATFVNGSATTTLLFSPIPSINEITFDSNLGANGSIVWNLGSLPIGIDINTILAQLSFKLKSTDDCNLLNNTACGNSILVTGFSNGIGATSKIAIYNSKFITGYLASGICSEQPDRQPLAIAIDGANYYNSNCQNTPFMINFAFENSNATISISEIALNFPEGTNFYDSYPITNTSFQYTNNYPFQVIPGEEKIYYAVIPNGISGCYYPFTITNAINTTLIDAVNDVFNLQCNTNGVIGMILQNDLLSGNSINSQDINLSLIGSVNTNILLNTNTGEISIQNGLAVGQYQIEYQICQTSNLNSCDTAIVQINIIDTINPLIPVLADVINNCSVTLIPPLTSDNCTGTITGTTTDPLNYDEFGEYIVTWNFEDGHGNSVSTTQNVIIKATSSTIEIKSDLADCNSDIDLVIDLNSLLPDSVPKNGIWLDIENSDGLTGSEFRPYEIPFGYYLFKYIFEENGCYKSVSVTMKVSEDCFVKPASSCVIKVFKAFSPNNDTKNEVFEIKNIEDPCILKNNVKIYNRWGALVFEADNYDNKTIAFKGISNGKNVVNQNVELPSGTYFYIINCTTTDQQIVEEGYLYLAR